jgi:dipeptidyl aminopeptidase/acylaminoacyl peptidase
MGLASGVRLGSYEIRGPLGAGGMGEVYRAWDVRLGREVAVKVLPEAAAGDPDRRRRFEQEARAAGALNHANVLAVYDVGSHDSMPYLVSELLDGETLRTAISAGVLTPRKAVEHGVQIARGLAAAHQRGIVHRDVKPENVFVARDGYVKILDFGLAKLREGGSSEPEDETATHQTRPGVVLGTVPYLSPEQVRGLPADARSDIFALGAVLYEMLARRRAFTGKARSEIEAAILRADPPELTATDRGVSPALDRVVRRCLEKRPEDRFQTAQDVAFALEAVEPGLTTAAQAAEAGPGPRPRAPIAIVAALLLGAPLGALLLAALRPGPSPPTYTKLTFRRGAVLSARFAPDGQTVVYSAAWDGQPAQVFTTRIGTGETRALGIEGVVLSVSANDEVAVKRGRFLGRRTAGQPDAGTLATVSLAGGAPRDLLDNVATADWDPDGRELAVVRWVDGKKRLEYPIGRIVSGAGFNVRVLPGGRFAMLESRDLDTVGSVAHDLVLVDGAGRKTVLSAGWSDVPNLSWSGATGEILFVSSRNGGAALHAVSLGGRERLVARLPGQFDQHDVDARGRILVERALDNGTLLALPPGETRERELSWPGAPESADLSADGRLILLTSWEGGLHLRKTDGSPAVRLGEYQGLSLSPDARWVLALPPGLDYSDRLLVVPTGAGEPRELRHPLVAHVRAAAWFPSGKRIAVVSGENRRPKQLLIWDIERDTPPRVLAPDVGTGRPVVSPDSRAVAATVGGIGPVLHPVDGSPSTPVRGGAARDEPLAFTSDGRWLFVRRTPTYHPNTTRVWIDRIELASGRRLPWKELGPSDPAGAMMIGRALVTPDGRSYAYSVGSSLRELFVAEGLR